MRRQLPILISILFIILLPVYSAAEEGESVDALIAALIEMLSDSEKAPAAVEELVSIGEDAIPALIETIGEEHYRASSWCADALVKIGSAVVLPVVEASLRSKGQTQYFFIHILQELGPEAIDGVPKLIEALGDAEANMGYPIESVLAQIGETAIPQLIVALGSENPRIRAGAADVLSRHGEKAKDAVPLLIELLDDSNIDIRTTAVSAIAMIDDSTNLEPYLMKMASEDDWWERFTAIRLIRNLGYESPEIDSILVDATADEDPWVRRIAVAALANIEPTDEIMDILLRAVDDADIGIRKHALSALAGHGADDEILIPILREFLADDDASLKHMALTVIGARGLKTPDIVTLAGSMLVDENFAICESAGEYISSIGADALPAKDFLYEAISDYITLLLMPGDGTWGYFERYGTRQVKFIANCVETLGAIGPDASDTVYLLSRVLATGNSELEKPAIVALGQIGAECPEAVPFLIDSMNDASPVVRENTAMTLGILAPHSALALPALYNAARNDPYEGVRVRAWDAIIILRDVGDEAVDLIIENLNNGDQKIRGTAALALGELGDHPDALAALVNALQSDKRNLRISALDAIGNIGSDASDLIPALIELLQDDDWIVRQHAAWALGGIGVANEEVVEWLTWLFDDEDIDVTFAARDALVELGVDIVPVLLTVPGVLGDYSYALTADMGPVVVPGLIEMLKSDDLLTVLFSLSALKEMDSSAKDAVPALVEIVKADESIFYEWAIEALGSIGPEPGVVDFLSELLSHDEWIIRHEAAKALVQIGSAAGGALYSLVDALKDPGKSIRRNAAKTLGLIRGSDDVVIPALIGALDDEDSNVRKQAAISLAYFGPDAKDAIPKLVENFRECKRDDRSKYAYALSCIGVETVPSLIELLDSDDENIRYYAVDAMRRIGPDAIEAHPKLTIMAEEDESSDVRYAARRAADTIIPPCPPSG
jgi:HEAT repeat protein